MPIIELTFYILSQLKPTLIIRLVLWHLRLDWCIFKFYFSKKLNYILKILSFVKKPDLGETEKEVFLKVKFSIRCVVPASWIEFVCVRVWLCLREREREREREWERERKKPISRPNPFNVAYILSLDQFQESCSPCEARLDLFKWCNQPFYL